MTYKTVLFDIDNTLINSAPLIAETLQKSTLKEGIDIPISKFRNLIGMPGDEILKKFGVDNWQRVLDRYSIEFSKNMHRLKYFPGIEDLFKKLNSSKIQVGVVTSKNKKQFIAETKMFPLIANLKLVTTSDNTEKPKPSGDPLIFALQRYNLDRKSTIYIGDSIYDMSAAREAKVDFAAANWGALPGTDFQSARYILSKPGDLMALVLD